MSQKIFEIATGMNIKNIETQLALQCAPLITGLKISNLLIVQNENMNKVKQMLKNTEISYLLLLSREEKTTFLLYKSDQLEQYLLDIKVRNLLKQLGYHEFEMGNIFLDFKERYKEYMSGGKEFPHEMGLLLGYPVEDVKGFIENKGKNFLCIGYWKVYENREEKVKLFQKYELAKETLIQFVANGVSMLDVIDIYSDNKLCQAAV